MPSQGFYLMTGVHFGVKYELGAALRKPFRDLWTVCHISELGGLQMSSQTGCIQDKGERHLTPLNGAQRLSDTY